MTDEEIMARAAVIQKQRNDAYQEECNRRYREERERREREDQAFAADLGVTWDQYQEIEARVRQRVYDES